MNCSDADQSECNDRELMLPDYDFLMEMAVLPDIVPSLSAEGVQNSCVIVYESRAMLCGVSTD